MTRPISPFRDKVLPKILQALFVITGIGLVAAIIYPIFAVPKYGHGVSILSNVKQINIAVAIYIADYENTFPPAQSQQTYRSLLSPYIKKDDIYDIGTEDYGTNILFNTRLANVTLSDIPNPEKTITLYTPYKRPSEQTISSWIVGFADSSVKQLELEEWDVTKVALDWNFPRQGDDFYPPETILP